MVKQVGNSIVGDVDVVESYTHSWYSLTVHPTTYYRKMNALSESLDVIQGLCAEIDLGSRVVIRFSDKADMYAFHQKHLEYI